MLNFNGVISRNTPDPERNRLQLAKPFFTGWPITLQIKFIGLKTQNVFGISHQCISIGLHKSGKQTIHVFVTISFENETYTKRDRNYANPAFLTEAFSGREKDFSVFWFVCVL